MPQLQERIRVEYMVQFMYATSKIAVYVDRCPKCCIATKECVYLCAHMRAAARAKFTRTVRELKKLE